MEQVDLPFGANMVRVLLDAMADPDGEMAELVRAHLGHVPEESKDEVSFIVAVAIVNDIGIAMTSRVRTQTVLANYLQAVGSVSKRLLISLAGLTGDATAAVCKDVAAYLKANQDRLFGHAPPPDEPTETTHAGTKSVH